MSISLSLQRLLSYGTLIDKSIIVFNSFVLLGVGTNNARLAAMLRQLAQYHAKDPANLFMVRLAQGLTHLAKGTLTLSPYHSDRQLLNQVALGGLLATTLAFLDVKNSESHDLSHDHTICL